MKIQLFSFLTFVSILLMNCTENNLPMDSPAELLRKPIVSTVDDKEHDFFLYLPKGYKNNPEKEWPVMMFLHGNGERGDGKDDLDYTMIHGPLMEAWIQKRDFPFLMIVPQLPMFGRDTMGLGYIDNRDKSMIPKRLEEGVPKRGTEGQPTNPMTGVVSSDEFPNGIKTLPAGWDWVEKDLLAMFDQVFENYKVDKKRVYLSGLSYGGFGTWYMASKHPEMFAAIVPVVGWGHPDYMPPIAEAKLPVWAFCGGRDPVIQAQYFYPGLNKLEELGHRVRFTNEEDMSHDVWRRVYGGQDVYDWMLSHSK